MGKDDCCNGDCRQGRDCPHREYFTLPEQDNGIKALLAYLPESILFWIVVLVLVLWGLS